MPHPRLLFRLYRRLSCFHSAGGGSSFDCAEMEFWVIPALSTSSWWSWAVGSCPTLVKVRGQIWFFFFRFISLKFGVFDILSWLKVDSLWLVALVTCGVILWPSSCSVVVFPFCQGFSFSFWNLLFCLAFLFSGGLWLLGSVLDFVSRMLIIEVASTAFNGQVSQFFSFEEVCGLLLVNDLDRIAVSVYKFEGPLWRFS